MRCPPVLALTPLLSLALATGGACQRSTPTNPSTKATVSASTQPFTQIFESQSSAYTLVEESAIRDRRAWEGTWAQLNNGLVAGPLPAVDFAREMVVFVAIGERSSAGTNVRIDRVEADGASATVAYTITEPGAGCMTAQVITSPVVAARTARVSGEVRFVRNTVRTPC